MEEGELVLVEGEEVVGVEETMEEEVMIKPNKCLLYLSKVLHICTAVFSYL